MNRGVNVVLHQLFAEQNRVLVIVTLPGHKSHQRVAAQGKLAVVGGGAVGNRFAGLHSLADFHNRLLVHTGALIGAFELLQMMNFQFTIIAAQHNLIAANPADNAVGAGNFTHAGIQTSLNLHTSAHKGSFRHQQGHSLTLHICAHQSAVSVIVLQERN